MFLTTTTSIPLVNAQSDFMGMKKRQGSKFRIIQLKIECVCHMFDLNIANNVFAKSLADIQMF